jgi:hypothetical protein
VTVAFLKVRLKKKQKQIENAVKSLKAGEKGISD